MNGSQNGPEGDWYWAVSYRSFEASSDLFSTYGEPASKYVLFNDGTFYVEDIGEEDGKPVFEIRFENGKITDLNHGDGLEHTIILKFNGP
ncbi:MAG: hypothetical protein II858_02325 [Bacteroidales bacterium]|nr:hypothetical protein [Bacteroidales bacterium]